MADRSAIEWTNSTWNPVTGCSKVSPGCAHCYAETLSLRYRWSKLPWTPANAAENVVLHPERLDKPLSWRKPRMVFVNSMSDLFHELIPDDFLRTVFAVMASSLHTYQVLTKRPERAREFLARHHWRAGLLPWAGPTRNHLLYRFLVPNAVDVSVPGLEGSGGVVVGPPENIWLGVSIENSRYTWRADVLREAPAAVKFISAEPLLGSLLNFATPSRGVPVAGSGLTPLSTLGEVEAGDSSPLAASADGPQSVQVGPRAARRSLDLTGIDWLIVGGESGPNYRPVELAWIRELRDACQQAGVAFFLKQIGGRTPKAGGKLLDGREWCEWPKASRAA